MKMALLAAAALTIGLIPTAGVSAHPPQFPSGPSPMPGPGPGPNIPGPGPNDPGPGPAPTQVLFFVHFKTCPHVPCQLAGPYGCIHDAEAAAAQLRARGFLVEGIITR